MTNKSPAGYALFDFDQTLLPWDSQLLFCRFVLKREPLRRLYLLVFLPFLLLSKVLGAGGMKRVFLSYLWRMKQERVEGFAEEFAEELYQKELYPEMLECLEKHQEAGHLTILTSASPQWYITAIGKKLGFDAAYGTRFEEVTSFPLFPEMVSENNKGEEKVVRMRLEGIIPNEGLLPNSTAYSDSKADLPILELCEKQVVVNPLPAFRLEAEKRGWELVSPKKPWATHGEFAIGCLKQMLGVGKS